MSDAYGTGTAMKRAKCEIVEIGHRMGSVTPVTTVTAMTRGIAPRRNIATTTTTTTTITAATTTTTRRAIANANATWTKRAPRGRRSAKRHASAKAARAHHALRRAKCNGTSVHHVHPVRGVRWIGTSENHAECQMPWTPECHSRDCMAGLYAADAYWRLSITTCRRPAVNLTWGGY